MELHDKYYDDKMWKKNEVKNDRNHLEQVLRELATKIEQVVFDAWKEVFKIFYKKKRVSTKYFYILCQHSGQNKQ